MNTGLDGRFASGLRQVLVAAVFCTWAAAAANSPAQTIVEGFLEPIRAIELSSDEVGAIVELPVEEGQRVSRGDIIARLDDRLQRLQVKLAEHHARSTAAIEMARHTVAKREQISQRLQQLRASGSASEGELMRAEMDLAHARAQLLAAEEDAVARSIDLQRANTQVERRLIRAPFNGVVARIHAREGEFLSPLRPEVVRLVKTDQLLAVFAIPVEYLDELRLGATYVVESLGATAAAGELVSIGVETQAESGTVLVKLQIDNTEGKLRSGQSCQLMLRELVP